MNDLNYVDTTNKNILGDDGNNHYELNLPVYLTASLSKMKEAQKRLIAERNISAMTVTTASCKAISMQLRLTARFHPTRRGIFAENISDSQGKQWRQYEFTAQLHHGLRF